MCEERLCEVSPRHTHSPDQERPTSIVGTTCGGRVTSKLTPVNMHKAVQIPGRGHTLNPGGLTWVQMGERAHHKVQCGHSQQEQQQELESNDPFDTREVDPQQGQKYSH